MSTPRFRILSRLPAVVPYVARFHASDEEANEAVEMRVFAGQHSTPEEACLREELGELVRVDHPAFFRPRASGTSDGRFFVVGQARGDAGQGTDFGVAADTPATRGLLVRRLADALAASTRQGISVSLLPPALLFWDPEAREIGFHHHRLPAGLLPAPAIQGVPTDVLPDGPAGPHRDVFLWGWMAYLVFSGGRSPTRLGLGVAGDLQRATPGLSLELAELVEASLYPSPEDRPPDPSAICAVLELAETGRLQAPRREPATLGVEQGDKSPTAQTPLETVDLSDAEAEAMVAVSARVRRTIQAAKIELPEADQAPTPTRSLELDLPDQLATEDALTASGVMDQGQLAALRAQEASPEAPPPGTRRRLAGLGAAFLGLVVLGALMTEPGTGAHPPQGPRASGAPTTEDADQPSTSAAKERPVDPAVRALLLRDSWPSNETGRVIEELRLFALTGRLRADFETKVRVLQLRRLNERDPAAAHLATQDFLVALRERLDGW